MTLFQQAIQWLNDPLNWTNPGGIFDRLAEHLRISAAAVLLGCLIAWPLGLWLGHRRRGGGAVITVSNVTLAVPTLSLLTLISLTALGIGQTAVILALTVFAIPPLLANAYTGLREVDPQVRDAARGMGLSGWQMLWRPGSGPPPSRWSRPRRSPRWSPAVGSARSFPRASGWASTWPVGRSSRAACWSRDWRCWSRVPSQSSNGWSPRGRCGAREACDGPAQRRRMCDSLPGGRSSSP